MSVENTEVVGSGGNESGGNDTAPAPVVAPVENDIAFAEAAANIGMSVEEAKAYAQNDPELARLLNAPKDGEATNENNRGDEPAGSGDSAAKSGEDDNIPPDDGDEKSDSDEQTETEQPADDNSGEDGADFADDVIPGLKGKDFAKLPTEAQVTVAQHFTEVSKKIAEAEARLAELNKLLDDPVVAQRKAVIENGVNLQVRYMTEDEKKDVAELIREKLGLEDSEAVEAIDALIPTLNQVINRAGQDYAIQQAGVLERQRKAQETVKQGEELLRGLSKYNPQLAIKETELSKFYNKLADGSFVYNDKHPEIETFKNGLGKIVDWAKNMGMDYGTILTMGEKPFYAAAAAANGLPVVINADSRDKTIAANAKKAALAPFLKTKAGNTLNLDGGAAVVPPKQDAIYREGIDIVRLVEDDKYYQEQIDKNPYSDTWRSKVERYVEEGSALISKRKK